MCLEGYFDEALNTLERFNILSSSSDLESRQGIIPPNSTRTVERLCYQLADKQLKQGNREKMEEVLTRLPSAADRITFLKNRGCTVEAARALEKEGRREEAARLLRDTGRFQEAVMFSSDPLFAADCLISQACTTKVTEDIPRILQSALVKYQHCNDINGQAEALLMLGKQFKDVQNIQEASKLFYKCKNCCGEVESIVELLKVTDHSPPETFGQWMAIRALERLFRLLKLLYKPTAQLSSVEHNEIEKCEKHFGLFPTGVAHTKVYFCNHGSRRFSRVDSEFVRNNVSKIEAKINATEAHQKIGHFLMSVSVSFTALIRKMLENTYLTNSLCKRKLTSGTPCDDSSCKYQHEDSEKLFSNRFHALFNYVYLESVVDQGVSQMTANNSWKYASLLKDKTLERFHACQRFHDFLFPLSGCRRHHALWSQIHNPEMTKAVHRRILQFAEYSWKETTKERRRSDTDNFLKVSLSLQMIGDGPLMVRWICEEENNFRKTTKGLKVTNDQLKKNGMVSSTLQGNADNYESYLHWWEDGKKRLYLQGNVVNAAHLIVRRFLTLTARRSGMIYPSISNTVMILEYQMTACLALYTRLCLQHRYPICLPGSYLTMVWFWDNFRPGVDKGTFTLYRAVEHSAGQETNKLRLLKPVCSILNYIVKLTCGDVASSFDVVGDAMALNSAKTEEAERSLVLFLTMLCNCGKGISASVEAVLLRKMLTLNPNTRLPSHIRKVLEDIQEAKGPSNIVTVLKTFLESRGEDLYDLRWHKSRLWYDGPSSPSDYSQKFHTDISIIRDDLKREGQQLKVEEPRDSETPGSDDISLERTDRDATAENMEVKHTDVELKEREEARLEVLVTNLQRLYRRRKLAKNIYLYYQFLKSGTLGRSRSIEEQSSASTDGSQEHFSRFRVDSTACGICGTNFTMSTDENLLTSHMANDGNPLCYLFGSHMK